jgi:hypothetical protein
MKNFLVNLFSNRFGIVLAALNLCYFASKIYNFTASPFAKIFVCAHFPAVALTIFSLEFVKLFVHKISPLAETTLGNIFFAVFVVFQWLFIAWIAKTVAQKFRPKEL